MILMKQTVHRFTSKIKKNQCFQKIISVKEQFLNWVEAHPWKTLVIIYFFFIVLKILISQLIVDVTSSYDSYFYSKMARSFWHDQVFMVNGEFSHQYPPLYPMAISPAYIFDDMIDITRATRIINVFISSLIVFPAFLLSKEFLDTKKSILVSTIVSGMAGNMSLVLHTYSENLYYPLLFFTLFLIYKSLLEIGYKFKIISGIFVGLCFLTKYTTGALFPAMLFVFIIISFCKKENSKIKKFLEGIKNWLIMSVFAAFIITPWLVRNGLHFGFSVSGMLGYSNWIASSSTKFSQFIGTSSSPVSSSPNYLYNLLIQIITNNAFIILGSGIIFFGTLIVFLYNSLKTREKKELAIGLLLIFVIESYVLLTSWHGLKNAWYLNGRYSEPLLPLIVLIGYVSIAKKKYIPRFHLIISIFLIPLSFLINLDLSRTAIMKTLSISHFISIIKSKEFFIAIGLQPIISSTLLIKLLSILFLVIIITTILFFIRKKNFKRLVAIGCILILSSSLISCVENVAIQYYSSKTEISDMGSYLNSNISGKKITVLFDEKSFSDRSGKIVQRAIGSWINAPIKIEKIEENISKENSVIIVSSRKFAYDQLHVFRISKPFACLTINEHWNMTLYVYYFEVVK